MNLRVACTKADVAGLATTSGATPNALNLTPAPTPSAFSSRENSPGTSSGSVMKKRASSVNLLSAASKPTFCGRESRQESRAHLQLPETPAVFRSRTSSGSNIASTSADSLDENSSGKKKKGTFGRVYSWACKKLSKNKQRERVRTSCASATSVPATPDFATAPATPMGTTPAGSEEKKEEEPQLIISTGPPANKPVSSTKKADSPAPERKENVEEPVQLPQKTRPKEKRTDIFSVGGRRYILRGLLGRGTYGQVFSAWDVDSGKKVAIKQFKKDNADARKEIEIYKRCSEQCEYLPKYLHATIFQGKLTLITERQGHNIQHLTSRIPKRRFYAQTVAMLGIELMNMFEEFHDSGYVHRDIHMGNVLAGHVDERKLYLCDLGFAQKYTKDDGSHYKKKELQVAVGTSRFSAINNHKHTRYSRRDDMESLSYLLINCLCGTLPWADKAKIQNRRQKWDSIMKDKLEFEESDFFLALPAELQKFTSEVRRLRFDQKPNYEAYRQLFEVMKFKEEQKHGQRHFDWMYVWDNACTVKAN